MDALILPGLIVFAGFAFGLFVGERKARRRKIFARRSVYH
jgi:hypothetical protein